MRDLITELDQAARAVASADLHGSPAHVVELQRTYRAPIDEVWSACTEPDRVRRWFLPVSGDLRPNGRFQLEGNAGGTISSCDPPRRLEVTWEFGDMEPGIVTLVLASIDDSATKLILSHTVADDDHWAEFGPGAVGVGWDLPLVVLSLLVTGDEVPTSEQFMNDPHTPELLRHSAASWGDAHASSGVSVKAAQQAAANTSAAYAPEPQPESH